MSHNNEEVCQLYFKNEVVPRLKAELAKTPHHVTHFPNMEFANVRFESRNSPDRKHQGFLYDGCYVMVKQQDLSKGKYPVVTCHLSLHGDMRGELDPMTYEDLDKLVTAIKNFAK